MSVAKTVDSSITKNNTSKYHIFHYYYIVQKDQERLSENVLGTPSVESSLVSPSLTIECEKISHNFNITHVVERKK
jgi:hypothetical protein